MGVRPPAYCGHSVIKSRGDGIMKRASHSKRGQHWLNAIYTAEDIAHRLTGRLKTL